MTSDLQIDSKALIDNLNAIWSQLLLWVPPTVAQIGVQVYLDKKNASRQQKQEYRKEALEGIAAFETAMRATSNYLTDLNAGTKTLDTDIHNELALLWNNASSKLALIDNNLAILLHDLGATKANYWTNWKQAFPSMSDDEVEKTGIAITQMQSKLDLFEANTKKSYCLKL